VPTTAAAPKLMTGRPNVLEVAVGGTAIPPLGPPERRISGVSLKPADLLARTAAPAPAVTAAPRAAAPRAVAPPAAAPPSTDPSAAAPPAAAPPPAPPPAAPPPTGQ
jgi:hypothetical protein